MDLTHLNEKGQVRMVDVGSKDPTRRTAMARGIITFTENIAEMLKKQPNTAKGNVFECARIAGIMGAKKTSEMIPLCHPLFITSASVNFEWQNQSIWAECLVKCEGKTGVEMEALHGVSIALLTLYDMTKALGKESRISNIHLVSKTGGKSGTWTSSEESHHV